MAQERHLCFFVAIFKNGSRNGEEMKVLRISVNEKPRSCVGCHLAPEYRRDCGVLKEKVQISGRMIYKMPDQRCKLVVIDDK